ncbi:MAG TPA: hypothetical protein VFZ52_19200 [Chryseolinea sp.]
MKRLLKLKPYIGSETTLLISSSASGLEKYLEFQDKIFIHHIRGSRLLRYDPQQREILQDHIENKSCSQVIFVGSYDQELIQQIETGDSLDSLKSALSFNLRPFLRGRHQQAIDPDVKIQMLVELNAINQCKLLMDYFFIKEKMEKNRLQVRGLVTQMGSEQLKSVFHNGVSYNDILTLN